MTSGTSSPVMAPSGRRISIGSERTLFSSFSSGTGLRSSTTAQMNAWPPGVRGGNCGLTATKSKAPGAS